MQKLLLLSLLLTTASCQTVGIQNTEECSVAGTIAAGMNCAETLSGKKREMTMDEMIVFLEPQASPTPRSGAICRSAEDFLKQKNALEQACRILGDKCSFELKQVIKTMESLL